MATIRSSEDAPFDRLYRRRDVRGRFCACRCRIVATGSSMRAALVEFEDGERVIIPIKALREAKS